VCVFLRYGIEDSEAVRLGNFLTKMLDYDPENRPNCLEMLGHEWLHGYVPQAVLDFVKQHKSTTVRTYDKQQWHLENGQDDHVDHVHMLKDFQNANANANANAKWMGAPNVQTVGIRRRMNMMQVQAQGQEHQHPIFVPDKRKDKQSWARSEMIRVMSQHQRSKLGSVERLLRRYSKKEDLLVSAVRRKYLAKHHLPNGQKNTNETTTTRQKSRREIAEEMVKRREAKDVKNALEVMDRREDSLERRLIHDDRDKTIQDRQQPGAGMPREFDGVDFRLPVSVLCNHASAASTALEDHMDALSTVRAASVAF